MKKDNDYKISIILPVYNREKYLKDTINSIINQDIGFENIELIIVDDNSTDNSQVIIKDYASKYENIKPILLKKNSGSPSKPRNIGLDNVTAPYLMFIDSDDYLTENCCSTIYNIAIKKDCDTVHFNYARLFDGDLYV